MQQYINSGILRTSVYRRLEQLKADSQCHTDYSAAAADGWISALEWVIEEINTQESHIRLNNEISM